jgi:hypothetical protein
VDRTTEFFRKNLELGRDDRDHIARNLGYGAVSLERVMSCEDNRVTVLSAGNIADGEGHLYRLPLPPTLSGVVGLRKLIISLAWLTPINPLQRGYRRAGLWISTPVSGLRTNRLCAAWQTVQR